jgi:ribose 1,5-bisphosphokinase
MTGASQPRSLGVFVGVVGPSGAGKDSIMRLASQMLHNDQDICFVRRVVTREAGSDEAHDTMTVETFREAAEAGQFALNWQANGLDYGIPASIHADLAAGRIVVANTSRDIAPEIKSKFPRAIIVHITASTEVLKERLAARGREDADTRDLRLARSIMLEQGFQADIRIENNGALETATKQFMNALLALKNAQSSGRASHA